MKEPQLPSTHFRTNVLLKSILGKDLINNDNIAVLELVKNSYDAGSPTVNIIFKNLKTNDDGVIDTYSENSSKIIIQDYGKAMNRNDIIDKWLNIAFSEKKYVKASSKPVAGSKGIGRFSCDRLGKYLDLYTKKFDEDKYIHLHIDWTQFEIENDKDLQIQQIPVQIKYIDKNIFEKKTGFKPFRTGTILEISRLRNVWVYLEKFRYKGKIGERWNIDALTNLRRYLERLINPNQMHDSKANFEVYLNVKEFLNKDKKNKDKIEDVDLINGKIENKIFEKLNFRTTFIISTIKLLNKEKLLTTKLYDKGRMIYEIIEDVTNKEEFKLLDDVKIIIYYLNTYAKHFFTKQMGLRAIDFGSIFLFRNGFRIPPYGDEGDDWLGLEVRKGQGQRRFLGTRDLVGRIEVNDIKNIFQEISNRAGIVKDRAYLNLTENYFYTILNRLEKYVVEGLNWDSIPEEMRDFAKRDDADFEEIFSLTQDEKDRRAMDAISSIIKTSGKEVRKLNINTELIATLATEEKEKFDKIYSEFQKFDIGRVDKGVTSTLLEINKVLNKKEEELKKLREKVVDSNSENIFTKGSEQDRSKDIVAMQHHINQATERIRHNIHNLRIGLIKNEPSDVLMPYLDLISFENRKIATLSKFVTKAKFNLVTTKIEKDLIQFIVEYIENVYKKYVDKRINKQLIEVFIYMKTTFGFIVKFRPIDFVIIIDNLLDNAIKAKANRMNIVIEKIKGQLFISFRDNGSGLNKSIKDPEQIFEFGFTTTINGTGIGLYHVREILKEMKGSINVNTSYTNGLELVITIRQ